MATRLTTEIFIKNSIEKHGLIYSYSRSIYRNSATKIIVTCMIHGDFLIYPRHHYHNGHGCTICSGKTMTTEGFIQRAKEIHGDKYDYSLVEYKNSISKVKIICPNGCIFEQAPNNHINKKMNCNKCFYDKKITKNSFLKRCSEIHGDKYIYHLNDDDFSNNFLHKIKITCKKHTLFLQSIKDHLSGRGCSKCGKIDAADLKRKSLFSFIQEAILIHGDKYDYSMAVYKNSKTKVKIKCPLHGFYKQQPNSHLMGRGCPKCNSSKGEGLISKFLIKKNIDFEYQKIFETCINPKTKSKLVFDFYLLDYNLLIEYDGEFHYKIVKKISNKESLKDQKYRDSVKNNWCLDNGITLLRIPYTSFDKIEQILERYLKKYANTKK